MKLTERLRGYNPPDRTTDEQRQIAIDIHAAVARIERLEAALRAWLEAADNCIDPVNGDDVTAMLRYGRAIDEARAALAEEGE